MARLSLLVFCLVFVVSSIGCRSGGQPFGRFDHQQTNPVFNQGYSQAPVQGTYNPTIGGGLFGNQQMPSMHQIGQNVGRRLFDAVINRGIGGALNAIF